MTDGVAPGDAGSAVAVDGEWVVTLDVESRTDSPTQADLAVRALAVAVAGSRTYVSARADGYSFTVIIGAAGAAAALPKGLGLLAVAQAKAGLPAAPVVCAEVTLVGTRPVPAASRLRIDCENPTS